MIDRDLENYYQKGGTYVIPTEVINQLTSELDDIKQENKKLKSNYERIYNENCKLREKHNINDISLLDEIEELKKQLSDREERLIRLRNNAEKHARRELFLEEQQKEFINWLKSMIKIYEEEYKDVDVSEHYNCVLSKYKEIIGVQNESR